MSLCSLFVFLAIFLSVVLSFSPGCPLVAMSAAAAIVPGYQTPIRPGASGVSTSDIGLITPATTSQGDIQPGGHPRWSGLTVSETLSFRAHSCPRRRSRPHSTTRGRLQPGLREKKNDGGTMAGGRGGRRDDRRNG
ncbi:hypothetical protein EYF80_015225 [Liparis tanakae]|uniref:Secreted protein n=1 Tax=Liparis tanakae TaxID=230148 RepID=A0A4Z2IAK9_9TELE|nr:hypothetical protein EYF80_015225 [Liparis tanakae]